MSQAKIGGTRLTGKLVILMGHLGRLQELRDVFFHALVLKYIYLHMLPANILLVG